MKSPDYLCSRYWVLNFNQVFQFRELVNWVSSLLFLVELAPSPEPRFLLYARFSASSASTTKGTTSFSTLCLRRRQGLGIFPLLFFLFYLRIQIYIFHHYQAGSIFYWCCTVPCVLMVWSKKRTNSNIILVVDACTTCQHILFYTVFTAFSKLI